MDKERAKRTWARGTKAGSRGPQKASSAIEWALTSERLRALGFPMPVSRCELPKLRECPDSHNLAGRKAPHL